MEKDYFTNKEIIMGLRDDFIYRNQILLEMEKIMKPLKKSIKVNATYDIGFFIINMSMKHH